MEVLIVDVELCAEGGSHEAFDNVEVPVAAFLGYQPSNLQRQASLAVERIVRQSIRREQQVVQSVLEAVRVVLLLHVAKPPRPGVRSGAETLRHDGADSAELTFGALYAVQNILSARRRRLRCGYAEESWTSSLAPFAPTRVPCCKVVPFQCARVPE